MQGLTPTRRSANHHLAPPRRSHPIGTLPFSLTSGATTPPGPAHTQLALASKPCNGFGVSQV
jgi:hypothetical protein